MECTLPLDNNLDGNQEDMNFGALLLFKKNFTFLAQTKKTTPLERVLLASIGNFSFKHNTQAAREFEVNQCLSSTWHTTLVAKSEICVILCWGTKLLKYVQLQPRALIWPKEILNTIELSISHPLFHPLSPLLSPPIPSFSGIYKVRNFY